MPKTRPPIPAGTARHIRIEAGYKCAIPHCNDKTGLELHHIDSNPTNNKSENILLLCANHHSQATKGEIDRKACFAIKTLLRKSVDTRSRSSTQQLDSRKEYIDTAFAYLSKNPHTYRATVVGPLMLHPEWYVRRRDNNSQYANYESLIFRYVKERSSARCHDIRFIFRNSERYKQKVHSLLLPNERMRFTEGVLKNIGLIWGNKLDRGPDVCCVDPGFFKVELIFDDAMIVGKRTNASTPISGGTLFMNSVDVERERNHFDSIFDESSEGQKVELEKLITFVKKLW